MGSRWIRGCGAGLAAASAAQGPSIIVQTPQEKTLDGPGRGRATWSDPLSPTAPIETARVVLKMTTAPPPHCTLAAHCHPHLHATFPLGRFCPLLPRAAPRRRTAPPAGQAVTRRAVPPTAVLPAAHQYLQSHPAAPSALFVATSRPRRHQPPPSLPTTPANLYWPPVPLRCERSALRK